jgi:hypothetical protein
MPNIFEDRDNLIADVFPQQAAVEVTYKRGATQIAWKATISRSQFEAGDGSGVVDTSLETRDYIGLWAGLTISGNRITPKAGDVIVHVVDGTTYERIVAAPPGQKVYELDAHYKMIRVRTWDRRQ